MDELIRKQDALDALMAERKHLLDKGQKGAEHVLTHHGYNVIDELPPVQSDVPVINVGDMISRDAATAAICKLCNDFDTDNPHIDAIIDIFDNLPSVQTEHIKGHWIEITSINHTYKCSVCGRLLVNITDGKNNVAKNYPYCHCGADMRGEADG